MANQTYEQIITSLEATIYSREIGEPKLEGDEHQDFEKELLNFVLSSKVNRFTGAGAITPSTVSLANRFYEFQRTIPASFPIQLGQLRLGQKMLVNVLDFDVAINAFGSITVECDLIKDFSGTDYPTIKADTTVLIICTEETADESDVQTACTIRVIVIAEVLNDTYKVIQTSDKSIKSAMLSIDSALLKDRNTCWQNGGFPSVDGGLGVGDTISITAGFGEILDTTDPDDPIYTPVSWEAYTEVALVNTSVAITYWYIDIDGVLNQTTVEPESEDKMLNIYLFRTSYTGGVISGITPIATVCGHTANTLEELARAIGTIKLQGLQPTYSGANLRLQITAGTLFSYGINVFYDSLNYNKKTLATFDTVGADRFRYAIPSGTIATDKEFVDPANYCPSGTVIAVPGATTRVTAQPVFVFESIPNYRLGYGKDFYTDMATAEASYIEIDPYANVPDSYKNALFLGFLLVQSGATDLSDPAQALFKPTNKVYFNGISYTAGGSYLQIGNNLSDLYSAITARANLGVLSEAEIETLIESYGYITTNLSSADQVIDDLERLITINTGKTLSIQMQKGTAIFTDAGTELATQDDFGNVDIIEARNGKIKHTSDLGFTMQGGGNYNPEYDSSYIQKHTLDSEIAGAIASSKEIRRTATTSDGFTFVVDSTAESRDVFVTKPEFIAIQFSSTNSGGVVTINIDGTGATNIYNVNTGALLENNDLLENYVYILVLNSFGNYVIHGVANSTSTGIEIQDATLDTNDYDIATDFDGQPDIVFFKVDATNPTTTPKLKLIINSLPVSEWDLVDETGAVLPIDVFEVGRIYQANFNSVNTNYEIQGINESYFI